MEHTKPKFKVGDKVTHKNSSRKHIYTIKEVKWGSHSNCYYYILEEDKYFFWYEKTLVKADE